MVHEDAQSIQPVEHLDELFDRLAALLKVEVYLYFTVAADGKHLELTAARGISDEQREAFGRLAIGEAACGDVARARRPSIIADVQQSTDPRAAWLRDLGLTGYVSRPLVAGGALMGTLGFGTRNGSGFSEASLALLGSVSQSVAISLRHRQIEAALRSSEQRFRGMFSQTAAGMAVLSPDGKLTEANQRCCEIFGYSRAELLVMADPVEQLSHPDELSVNRDLLREVIEGERSEQHVERRCVRKGGEVAWLNLAVSALRDADGRLTELIGVIDDVTARKRSEQALQESEARAEQRRRLYETIMSSTPDFVYVFDLEHRLRYANAALLKMWGRRWDQVIGKKLLEIGYEADQAARHEREIGQVIATHEPIKGEIPFTGTYGRRIYEYIFAPVPGPDGGVEAVAGTTRDVTERKRAERALAAELADMRRLQQISARLIPEGDVDVLLDEILGAAIAISGADTGNLQMVDPGTKELVIRTQQGLDDAFLSRLARIGSGSRSACAEALATGRRIVVVDSETNDIYADSPLREVMLDAGVRAEQCTPLISRAGEVLGVISTHWQQAHEPAERELRLLDLLARQAADLLERHHAGRSLRESERHLRELSQSLEARVADRTAELQEKTARLRSLAAEVATAEHRERRRLAAILHDDLQQLLIAAKMHLSQVTQRLHDDSAVETVTKVGRRIDEAADAARNLTRQLRPPVLYEAGLLPALRWLASEMAERHRMRVTVEAGGEDAGQCLSDDVRALLYECVRELLFNVVRYAGVDEAAVEVREDADCLRLTVRDEGRGFEIEAGMRHLHRSGLGLFSIRERLTALGGSMTIDTGIARGARIELAVPIPARCVERPEPQADALSSGAGRAPPASVAGPGAARVLVVDDHAIVREGVANLLNSDKRLVVVGEAADGLEAIEAVEQQQPDVVLVDVNMPRMNGVEATRQIHRRWPHVIVVGLSVQRDEATADAMLDAGAAAFVAKCGDSEHMIATILDLMSRSAL